MALTQKKVKEQIELAEKMIADTVKERTELLAIIRKEVGDSNKISPEEDESIVEKVDEYNGLLATIQYYTGHLNALEWTLKEMKTKKKKKETE